MRTLLLADDSVTVQRVIALTFAEEPIRVVTVADGQQAMEKMAALRPDIVLAGTTLPQVSGYDLARFIRSKADLRAVPVLLLSGAFETVDPARLTSSGANGVLEKPVEPTIVIGRVKELLGMKGDARPAAGRMITPADAPAARGGDAAPERKLPVPVPPRAVTSTRGTPSRWEQLRNQTGLEPDTRSVEDSSSRPDDYLDTLDAAFDTLDQQLSGRIPATKTPRNPAGPLGQSPGAGDPRSPGRTPPTAAPPAPGNAVYEVDDEWFGGAENQSRATADTVRSDLHEDLHDPELRLPQRPAPANPIYEVDDEWFAEDEQARAKRLVEQKQLAAEMGIHDVELPETSRAIVHAAAPVKDDLDFSIDDIKRIQATAVPEIRVPAPAPPPPPEAPRPAQPPPPPPVVSVVPPPATLQPLAPPIVPMPRLAPVEPPHASVIADDFAALLAFEQGERLHPPGFALAESGGLRRDQPAPAEIKVVAPEITDDMLEQIASRVADRLSASTFGDRLKDTMSSALRDTVRTVVSETSERLVREEIERIKSRKSQ